VRLLLIGQFPPRAPAWKFQAKNLIACTGVRCAQTSLSTISPADLHRKAKSPTHCAANASAKHSVARRNLPHPCWRQSRRCCCYASCYFLRPLSSLSSSHCRSFGGQLASIKAPQLGAVAIKGAVERAGIPPEYVQVNPSNTRPSRAAHKIPRCCQSTSQASPCLSQTPQFQWQCCRRHTLAAFAKRISAKLRRGRQ
jgi:hypothetical protein